MADPEDHVRNVSTDPVIGAVALAIAPPADAVSITVDALPDIGAVVLPGGRALQIGHPLTAAQLASLRYDPATVGAGGGRFSYDVVDVDGRRSSGAVDLTTMGSVSGQALYFQARDAHFGRELWRVNSFGQVDLAADLLPGGPDSSPRGMTAFGDHLYFSAIHDPDPQTALNDGQELWRIGRDGVVEFVADLNPGQNWSLPSDFTEFDGALYFSATRGDIGNELWRVRADGTVELVADINAGAGGSLPKQFVQFADALYFSARTEAQGVELWRVAQGGSVELVRDIYDGSSSSNPGGFTRYGDEMYFSASSRGYGQELWRITAQGVVERATDGNPGGFSFGPSDFIVFNGQLYFQATDSRFGADYDLWRYGGSGDPVKVHDFSARGAIFSDLQWMTVFNGALYFTIHEGDFGRELWRALPGDRVELVADLEPGGGSSTPHVWGEFAGALYFSADTADAGRELWRLLRDGTLERLPEVNPGPDGGVGAPGPWFAGGIHFRGNDGVTGVELWRLDRDGTTHLVSDIWGGPTDAFPMDFGATVFPYDTTIGMPQGSLRDDILHGLDSADSSDAGPGDDRMIGRGGDDTLAGGDGADTLNGGDGDDFILGGATDRDLRDVIFGGAGNDRIDAGHGNDLIYGGEGDDTVEGGFGVDEIIGQGGNDVLTGSAFSDLIFGGDGNDFVNGGFGSDRVNGGAGADRFYHLGIADHGSDWIQDYSSADGDRLVWGGGAAVRSQFQVNLTETAGAGAAGVDKAFVIYRPTGQILWALVDGGAQSSINLQIGGQVFDLLA